MANFTTVHGEQVTVRPSSSVEPSVWIDMDGKVILIRVETLRAIADQAEIWAEQGTTP